MSTPVKLNVPPQGQKITIQNGKLSVPDQPIIPFIEGDGTGPDIWRASVRVMDAAVQKAYGGKRKIHWMEVYAGQKSNDMFNTWLPDETVQACRDYLVSINGPLTTPIGGGIRSLNVALRQMLDLYVCLRPVRRWRSRAFELTARMHSCLTRRASALSANEGNSRPAWAASLRSRSPTSTSA